MKSKQTLKKESSYLPLRNIVKAEMVKVFENNISKIIIAITLIITLVMFFLSIYRFKDNMEWISPFSGIASPVTTFMAVLFILSLTDEWTRGTGMITYCFVPQRGRIILGKFLVMLYSFIVVSILLLAFTAMASLISSILYNTHIIWKASFFSILERLLPLLFNLLFGFTFALLVQDMVIALSLYFLIPSITIMFTELPMIGTYAKWLSFKHASLLIRTESIDLSNSQFLTSTLVWIIIPLILGCLRNQKGLS